MSKSHSKKKIFLSEKEELDFRLNEVDTLSTKMEGFLENDNMQHALDIACQICEHLRDATFSPKSYYALYLEVQTKFGVLASYLRNKTGKVLITYYEKVQYFSHVIPRLYLMCTVGSACIFQKKVSVPDFLHDLTAMCKSVQNPIRGLFLRTYLLDTLKPVLPDINSKKDDGCLEDSTEFLIENFTETNKLNHRLANKDKESQTQLCQLVAKNLSVLAGLEGISMESYKTTILPQILLQISVGGDDVAQMYLMDAVINVFPVKMHLYTLKPIVRTAVTLPQNVDVSKLFKEIIEKLVIYIDTVKEDQTEIYDILDDGMKEVFLHEKNTKENGLQWIKEFVVLMKKWYGVQKAFNIDKKTIKKVVEFCLTKKQPNDTKSSTENVTGKDEPWNTHVVAFIEAICVHQNILDVIQMDGTLDLIESIGLSSRHLLQKRIVELFITSGLPVSNSEDFTLFINATNLIHRDGETVNLETIREDSSLSAAFIQRLSIHNPEEMMATLREMKGIISVSCALRKKIVLPALCFKILQITPKSKNVFVGALDVIKILVKQNESLLALRLALCCSMHQNENDVDVSAFFEYALSLFENNITAPQDKKSAFEMIVGTVCFLRIDDKEKYIQMATQVTKYSQTLEDIPSKVACIAMSSAMWVKREQDVSKSNCVQCLQKALKEANLSSDNVALFVDILNRYICLFKYGQTDLKKYIVQLVGVIKENIGTIKEQTIVKYFEQTCLYICDLLN